MEEKFENRPEETVDQKLTSAVLMISRVLKRQLMNHNQPENRNFAQQRALAVLAMQDDISQNQLGYILGIRPQSVGEMIGKMEKSGLIERIDDVNDKRQVRIRLTAAGRQQSQTEPSQPESFAMLTEQEKQQLMQLLEKILANTDDQLKQPRWDHHDHDATRGRQMPYEFGSRRSQGRPMPFEFDMPRPHGPHDDDHEGGFHRPHGQHDFEDAPEDEEKEV